MSPLTSVYLSSIRPAVIFVFVAAVGVAVLGVRALPITGTRPTARPAAAAAITVFLFLLMNDAARPGAIAARTILIFSSLMNLAP
ncbi:MAG: hypothetical protein BWY90_01698 [Deltaproteobacteria bacterium ADurb.BinA014]|nr:MAG: hypothetical protein BWY90_01698 [Deltaproteobacteria bacterium ADurb.BinA014]